VYIIYWSSNTKCSNDTHFNFSVIKVNLSFQLSKLTWYVLLNDWPDGSVIAFLAMVLPRLSLCVFISHSSDLRYCSNDPTSFRIISISHFRSLISFSLSPSWCLSVESVLFLEFRSVSLLLASLPILS